MDSVRPVIEGLEMYEQTLGGEDSKNPEYRAIFILRSPEGKFVSRWRLSREEKEIIANGGDIFLSLIVGSGYYPPTHLQVGITADAELWRKDMRLDDEIELRMLAVNCREANKRLEEAKNQYEHKRSAIFPESK